MQILIDNCPNTYRLCDDNNQKFILLLRKGVYPYEYIDDLIKFDETKLTTKENFYSNLHLKKNYRQRLRTWKKYMDYLFNIKTLGEYHDLYVQSDTLLLSDVFEAFRKTCIKQYELDATYFVSAPGLSWKAYLA